ncbi:hypothetical protein GGR22_000725 [Flavobacterium gossypii]|uniref:Uncharacterized protein n=1 Tax=Flavobacterium gossypii TaxID=1646119 RepID=A0ABR6DMD3_9FLAO|nr:hypothetical protein [Flavobacterium gossypii]MBA9072599.1 hypothetical protein [Flavobacterium gossypii]
MEISFGKSKECDAFKELMDNPTDRKAIKNFNRSYNQTILKASIKIYQKLKNSDNAFIYNLTASGGNKIEKASGVKDKNPVVLKVRIQDSYRKFFNFYETNTAGVEDFCTINNWCGQFDKVCKIHVFEVNKHDYSVI